MQECYLFRNIPVCANHAALNRKTAGLLSCQLGNSAQLRNYTALDLGLQVICFGFPKRWMRLASKAQGALPSQSPKRRTASRKVSRQTSTSSLTRSPFMSSRVWPTLRSSEAASLRSLIRRPRRSAIRLVSEGERFASTRRVLITPASKSRALSKKFCKAKKRAHSANSS